MMKPPTEQPHLYLSPRITENSSTLLRLQEWKSLALTKAQERSIAGALDFGEVFRGSCGSSFSVARLKYVTERNKQVFLKPLFPSPTVKPQEFLWHGCCYSKRVTKGTELRKRYEKTKSEDKVQKSNLK